MNRPFLPEYALFNEVQNKRPWLNRDCMCTKGPPFAVWTMPEWNFVHNGFNRKSLTCSSI